MSGTANEPMSKDQQDDDREYPKVQDQNWEWDRVSAADDPDVVALQEAEREAQEAERADSEGQGQTGQDSNQAGDQSGDQSQQTGQQTDGKGKDQAQDDPMIPKRRFDEVRTKGREAAQQAIRTQAQLDYLQQLIQQGYLVPNGSGGGQAAEGQDGQQQAQTFDDRIKSLRGEQTELAKKFQNGDLDADQWEEQRQQLDDQLYALRRAKEQEEQGERQQRQPARERGDAYLEARTAEIERQHPVLTHLSAEELTPLANRAKQIMEQEGQPFDPQSNMSILDLRQRTAELASKSFSWMLPQDQQSAAQASGQNAGQAAQQKQGGQQQQGGVTADQRKDKLEQARKHPPDLENAPSAPASGTEGLTEERLASMTTEEIAALPPEVLDRIESQGL